MRASRVKFSKAINHADSLFKVSRIFFSAP